MMLSILMPNDAVEDDIFHGIIGTIIVVREINCITTNLITRGIGSGMGPRSKWFMVHLMAVDGSCFLP